MSSRLLLGALFASLALNVFIGGAIVGAYLTKANSPPPEATAAVAGRARNPLMGAMLSLPPEARAAWRESNRDFAKSQGPRAQEARRQAREAMRRFGDEPFDAAAASAALESARRVEYENRVALDRRIVAFVATLPREQRAAFGEALARPPPFERQRPRRED